MDWHIGGLIFLSGLALVELVLILIAASHNEKAEAWAAMVCRAHRENAAIEKVRRIVCREKMIEANSKVSLLEGRLSERVETASQN